MSARTIGQADVAEAFDFVRGLFAGWSDQGSSNEIPFLAIVAELNKRRVQWHEAMKSSPPWGSDMVLPGWDSELEDSAAARSFWCHQFAALEIRRLADIGLVRPADCDLWLTELRQRAAELRERLLATQSAERLQTSPRPKPRPTPIPAVLDNEGRAAAAPRRDRRRRNLLEILLDPRSIHWLLGSGGALVVLGLIILLALHREFLENRFVALTLAGVNVGVLLAGWLVIRETRYQLAGKALTLLACLILPVNLWYFHAINFITLGGHLWVMALAISALYAASALVLRDEVFVYIFVAGVTLTGMLFLCDLPPSPERFQEIALPSTLLVVLGLLAIHVERAFPEQEGPFGRKRFGLAFFWSGHALLASGLLLVLGAQLAGHWLYEPLFKGLYERLGATPSPIVGELRLLALGLVLAGTYAYIYSDLVVRKIGVYIYLAAGTLLWAEVLIIELLQLHLQADVLIAILASTAIVVNVAQSLMARSDYKWSRAFPSLGLLLCLVPVLLGAIVFLRAVFGDLYSVQAAVLTRRYVAAMLLTVVSCRVGAHLHRQSVRLCTVYFFGSATALLTGAAALLVVFGLTRWQQQAPILMLIPIGYLVAGQLYQGRHVEQRLVWVSHATTAIILISSAGPMALGFTQLAAQPLHRDLAVFCSEAALFYALAAALRKQVASVCLATALACAAVWHLLTFVSVPAEYYTLAFAILGLAVMIAYRLGVLERLAAKQLAEAAFQSANMLLSLSLLATIFLGLSRLAAQGINWPFVGKWLVFAALSVTAALLSREASWRSWYIVATVGLVIVAAVAMGMLSTLTAWQKLELFSTVIGLLLLGIGHVGWYREQDRHDDMVSFSLFLGALLASVPLAIATVIDRYRGDFAGFHVLNELGFITVGLLLLITGVLFQLRSTTLTGAVLTVLYFGTLPVLVPWSELWGRLNAMAILITAGGGTIFASGLLLSVYRERLLALPDRIKRREGVFRVLGWR